MANEIYFSRNGCSPAMPTQLNSLPRRRCDVEISPETVPRFAYTRMSSSGQKQTIRSLFESGERYDTRKKSSAFLLDHGAPFRLFSDLRQNQ